MALLNNADAIYFGDRHVDRVYLGAQRVWPWTPELLFQNGEQGGLYSLTPDFAGLYQDDRATTPVTAVGQPVGLMLDRRFGLVRGPELRPSGYVDRIGSGSVGSYDPITGDGVVYRNSVGSQSVIAFDGLDASSPYRFAWTSSDSIITLRTDFTGTIISNLSASPGGGAIFIGPGLTRVVVARTFDSASGYTIQGLSLQAIPGNHASQPTTTARPALRSSPLRIDYDGADDFLRTTFPNALGSNVTIARSIPGEGAQILTGQTVGAEWDDNVTSCATLVIDRALTGSETALVTAFLNQQAGV